MITSTQYTSVALTWSFFPLFFFHQLYHTVHGDQDRSITVLSHSDSASWETSCIIDFQFVFYTVDRCANLHDQECCEIKYSRLSKLPEEVCEGSKTHITREQRKQ